MKKTMIFAAAAAMFMFASCQKEEVMPGQNSQSEELVFMATIDQPATKTTINTDGTSADKGKVSWVVNDEISVTDGANTAVYYIKEASDIAADGSATFTYKSGDRPSSTASSYTATYGNAITTAQTYSSTAGKLPMSGVSDSGDKTKLKFTVTCGLLKLNLTANGSGTNAKDISRIEIVGRLDGAAKDTLFALTCDNESIESATDFYIALPAGSYNLMKFINSKGCVCFKKATTAMAIEANKIQPVTLSGITFSALLPGKFTVSSTGKQVQFTRGNLYWNGSDYAFETEQTGYDKGTYDEISETTYYTPSHVSHFYWTNYADYTNGIKPYAKDFEYLTFTADDKFWCGEDNPLPVDNQSGLYTLTADEWCYLLNYDPSLNDGDGGLKTDGNVRQDKFKNGVTVNGTAKCLVIAPDGYTGPIASSYDAAAWAIAESDGLVCLPAASERYGDGLQVWVPFNYYCTATREKVTVYEEWSKKYVDYTYTYCLFFYYVYYEEDNETSEDVCPKNYVDPDGGYCIRLVCSVVPK